MGSEEEIDRRYDSEEAHGFEKQGNEYAESRKNRDQRSKQQPERHEFYRGDVLAMVSTPAFEIDRFTGTIDRQAWVRVVQDPTHPLLNRAIQSQYAPGSIFKIVVAAAGLQEGTITPADRTNCTGEFHLGALALAVSRLGQLALEEARGR